MRLRVSRTTVFDSVQSASTCFIYMSLSRICYYVVVEIFTVVFDSVLSFLVAVLFV
jgi:hypothetical protein